MSQTEQYGGVSKVEPYVCFNCTQFHPTKDMIDDFG